MNSNRNERRDFVRTNCKKERSQHYNEYEVRSDPANGPVEPDKSKSISELSQEELRNMIGRLGAERELESIIRS